MVESVMKCSWRAPEGLRKDFNPKETAELPITPTICLVPLAKFYQSPAKRDRGLSLRVLPPSSLSQKPKKVFSVLDMNQWFKECWILCCRLGKPQSVQAAFSQSWFSSSACFHPRSTSSQSFPLQSWHCQLPAEVRVKVCSPCQRNLGMCYISWMLEMQRSFLWRLLRSVIACYNVWAQRGVQKLFLAKYFPAF